MAAAMYHAAIETVSGLRIGGVAHKDADTMIFIQHPDRRVAENLGAAFTRDHEIELRTLQPLLRDAVEAVREQVVVPYDVTGIIIAHYRMTTLVLENGDPTQPVDEIEVTLDEDVRGDFLLIITIPYDKDRYKDTYELGTWVGPKPARTNACATCEHDQPEFRCSACKTALYCGKACQTKAWVRGHDKECS